ncbi:hypothetical protein HORM4_1250009 [Vibrio harveyi]|uniref:Uncharacterized protein n=1 Tax=Vibrio harveyi TaxID=669 RepID=S5FNP6_VIBHA|nr:hypothetical protein [Vibrio harveyi]AGQ45479.1 hypothetical protein [Vibrio harveyi]AGW25575.1 hypothetical protein [Vibrio harveyi]CAK6712670.1 hypothetical protein HORM4_1250009 [Vibrio harveyi]
MMKKTYENALKNLSTIQRHVDIILSSEWEYCQQNDESNDIYSSLRAINTLLSGIRSYVKVIDDEAQATLSQASHIISSVTYGDQPKSFFEEHFVKAFFGTLPDLIERIHGLDLQGVRNTKPEVKIQYSHGGYRVGAGRKKKEKTQQIRIPESLVSDISELKEIYSHLGSEDKERIIQRIQDLVQAVKDGNF